MFILKGWTSLLKLLHTELMCLAMKCGDLGEGDKTKLLEFLTGLTLENQKLLEGEFSKPKQRKSKCQNCNEELCVDCALMAQQIAEGTYWWSESELKTLSSCKLKEVCQKLRVKHDGNISDKIERILFVQNPDEIENLKQEVGNFLGKARTDHIQIHNFYKSQFSIVDKANQHEFGTVFFFFLRQTLFN